MKSLLGKIAIKRVAGLYLGEHEVVASDVAVTPLGLVEVASYVEPCPPNELLNVIERVFQTLQGSRRRRLHVGIGLANSRVFFGTRPLRGGVDPTPEGVIQRLLTSSDISVDDLTIDLLKTNVDKAPVASVAACRKKYMAAILGVLERCGAQPVRTEPASCAMVRAAMRMHGVPRRAKTLLWLFLGADDGLAVLTSSGLPLAWRPFALPEFSEKMAILSAARTLLSQSQYHGLDAALDYAIVHGRPDIHERLQQDGLPSDMGARTIWRDKPELNGATTAFGLALGCLNQTSPTFDLSRTMKPRPLLRDIFPWGELAAECAVMLAMGLLLAHQSDRVEAAYSTAKIQCSGNKLLATMNTSQLENEKRDLAKRIGAVHTFLDSRVAWTSYLRMLPTCLPAKIQLDNLQGAAALPSGGRGGAHSKKSLQLLATAPLTSAGSVPPEVSQLVATLRRNALIKRDFPQVELTNIRQSQAKGDSLGQTGFTIVCQPGERRAK